MIQFPPSGWENSPTLHQWLNNQGFGPTPVIDSAGPSLFGRTVGHSAGYVMGLIGTCAECKYNWL